MRIMGKVIIESSPYWEFLESFIKKATFPQTELHYGKQLQMPFDAPAERGKGG